MLIGEFETKISDKNRLALPKKFRDELGQRIIITSGYEGCLIVVNETMFLDLTKEITNGRFINDSVRDSTRFLIGSAQEIEMDNQGRFVLPNVLKTYADIKQEVTFLGLMRWIEVWDKDIWIKRKSKVISESSEIASKLENSIKSQ